MSEFRKDPITGRWVIIASQRAKRPRQLGTSNSPTQNEPCPFCTGNEALTPPEVWALREANTQANAPGWRVRVVPNKYPALEREGVWRDSSDGFYQSQRGLGVHEVIIECPDHVVNMAELSYDQFADILRAYRERLRALNGDRRWRYLLIYKNHGDRAGATFEHLHSQLVALPSVPKEAADEIDGARAHYTASNRCIYCAIIEREIATGERLVFNHESFVALCPFAPRFAYETWLLPKTHAAVFDRCSDEMILEYAHALRETVTRLNCALADPPFNYFIHSLPTNEAAGAHYHWHLEMLPQLSRAAGFEWGSGSNINSVAPEDAAKLLRDVAL